MYVEHLLLWCLVSCLAHEISTTPSSDQEDNFIHLKTNRTVSLEEACKEVPCLVKCCPMNQILLKSGDENGTITLTCINNPEKYGVHSPHDYSNKIDIYDKDIKKKIKKTDKKLTDFTFLSHEKFNGMNCNCFNLLDAFVEPTNFNYLTEDGRLLTSRRNYLNNWLSEMKMEDFCFENEIIVNEKDEAESPSPKIALYIISTLVTDPINRRAKISAYGMLISCGFMLLVLAVYGLLKELRNLAGMMLMAYVATLTVAFLFRAIQVFANDFDLMGPLSCIVVGLIFLYTLLASFTWMNVMSFDIWWSMRGFYKRRTHKRGIPVKFAWYCLYGWGVPLIPVLFIVIVEHLDLSHLPNFVKPHIIVDPDECFLPEDERQLYLNGPIAITTLINLVLFMMTAYNIWRIKTGVSNSAESHRNKKDENRFSIYLKLSMVMGISWIMEVMSSLVDPESPAWYISDIYNALIGLFIFVIFVFKRKIWVRLCIRRSESHQRLRETWEQYRYSVNPYPLPTKVLNMNNFGGRGALLEYGSKVKMSSLKRVIATLARRRQLVARGEDKGMLLIL